MSTIQSATEAVALVYTASGKVHAANLDTMQPLCGAKYRRYQMFAVAPGIYASPAACPTCREIVPA